MNKQNKTVSLRELREKTADLLQEIDKGQSYTVFKRSQPIFKISPLNEDERWEEVVDFTKIKKGGVDIDDILSRV